MKLIYVLIGLMAMVVLATGQIQTAFDNFNRSTLGSNWTTVSGFYDIDIQGDTAAHKSASGWCGARYTAVDSTSKQTATARIYYNTYTFIAIRWQRSTSTGYALGWGGAINSIEIYEFINGSYSAITSTGSSAPAASRRGAA